MVQLGFDVDVLEVHLRELYDVVDFFFIIESTRTHFHTIKKPLIWESVQSQERFKVFSDKVVHLIMDDVISAPKKSDENDIWFEEALQERVRAQEFMAWNSKQEKPLTADDWVGFGDTDQVANRLNIHLLRHCVPIADSVDIGIWFPSGRIDNAFRTDFPVSGHPYSLGDPTFMTLARVERLMSSGTTATRVRGTSGQFLLSGMHMTRHQYVPFMMLEPITCTECGWKDPAFVKEVQQVMTSGSMARIEEYWIRFHLDRLVHRTIPLKDLPESERALVYVPWFLACQPDRYPYWTGRHDFRLDTNSN